MTTESAIMAAAIHVKREKVKGNYSVLVSLDIQGTFNNFPWDLIVDILRSFPIDEESLPLIKGYLNGRKVSYFDGDNLQTF